MTRIGSFPPKSEKEINRDVGQFTNKKTILFNNRYPLKCILIANIYLHDLMICWHQQLIKGYDVINVYDKISIWKNITIHLFEMFNTLPIKINVDDSLK